LKTEEKTNASAGSDVDGLSRPLVRAVCQFGRVTPATNQQAGTQPADRTWNLGRGEQISAQAEALTGSFRLITVPSGW
jgi:hypothetical protein